MAPDNPEEASAVAAMWGGVAFRYRHPASASGNVSRTFEGDARSLLPRWRDWMLFGAANINLGALGIPDVTGYRDTSTR